MFKRVNAEQLALLDCLCVLVFLHILGGGAHEMC